MDLIAIALLGLAVLCCYANTLDSDFVHDDTIEILQNEYVRDFSNLGQILTTSAWKFLSKEGEIRGSNYYRPVQYLTYSILYHLVGDSAWLYHLFKLMLHLGTCLLLYLMVRNGWNDYWLALLSAIFFAIHPINTEAVSWISGITDVSCAFFFLFAFYFYFRYRSSSKLAYLIGMNLAFFLGLFSKEVMVTFIAVLLLLDLMAFRKSLDLSRGLTVYVPLVVEAFIYLILRIHAIGSFTYQGQYQYDFLSWYESFLNRIALLGNYFLAFFFPLHLNAHHIFHPVFGASDFRVYLTIVILTGIVLIIWKVQVHGDHPYSLVVPWGLFWFVLALTPVLVFFKRIGENIFAERYLYLPSAGICMSVAALLLLLEKRASKSTRGGIILLLVLLSLKTIRRNEVWHDNLTFYSTTVRDSPGVGFLLNNLAFELSRKGRNEEAVKVVKEAINARPDLLEAFENLGRISKELGHYEESVAAYEKAARLAPNSFRVYFGLAETYVAQNRKKEAIGAYQKAVAIDPHWELYFTLAGLLAGEERFQEAIEAYNSASQLNPGDSRIFSAQADLFFALKRYEEAISGYEKSLSLNPDNLRDRFNLADAYMSNERYNDALSSYELALSLSPRDAARAYRGMASAYAGKKDAGRAALFAQKALTAKP